MDAIDPETARQFSQDFPREVVQSLVESFTEDQSRLLRTMAAAAASGDAAAWRDAAHGLAGAAGGVGAQQLEALARGAMRPGAEPDADLLAELQNGARNAVAALGRMLG
ncbi:Hpt domain-containing protein [Roseomonas sp. BN140053]|uniref:Hpt domain-containing protein n=1 Tax=Roseomonas sp. BN140053 TaxID=3391898 RepID=UPI0039E8498A